MQAAPPAPSTPAARSRLFVIIDGQPQGPFGTLQILTSLDRGLLTPETLICAEGSSAWVSLREFFADDPDAFPAPLPDTAPVPAPAAPPEVFQPVPHHAARRDTRGWEITLLLASVLLWFMNWVQWGETCSQTGYQAATGTGESNPYATGYPHVRSLATFIVSGKHSEVPAARLCIAASLCLAMGLFLSLTCKSRRVTGFAVLTAAALLVIQSVRGFPLERQVTDSVDRLVARHTERPSVGLAPGPETDQLNQQLDALQVIKSMEVPNIRSHFDVRYTFFFHLTVSCLIGAGVIALFGPSKSWSPGRS